MQQTILITAQLRKVNLTNANLINADLSGVNLSGADLSNADLRGANLSNANLKGATLSGTNLSTNTNFCGTIMPDGSAKALLIGNWSLKSVYPVSNRKSKI